MPIATAIRCVGTLLMIVAAATNGGCEESSQSPPADELPRIVNPHIDEKNAEPKSVDENPSTGPLVPDWPEYHQSHFSVRAPGRVDTNTVYPKSGAFVLLTVGHQSVVSITVMPVTSMHLMLTGLEAGDVEVIHNGIDSMYPGLRGKTIEALSSPADVAGRFDYTLNDSVGGLAPRGRVWHWPEAGVLVFLSVFAVDQATSTLLLDQVASTLKIATPLTIDPLMASTSVRVQVPGDWNVTTDIKKHYWASPDGQSFFMYSKPFPAPGSDQMVNYGTTAAMAGDAIRVAEALSGRTFIIGRSELVFEPRLWCLISKADATVQYNSGEYQVEMWRWIDPRTRSFHRVYFGGRTPEDFQRAHAVAETYTLVPNVLDE